MWYGIVADAVCVSPVVSQYFILVLYLVFFKLLLFGLLTPTFFIALHSFHQSRLIEMILSISLMLSDDSVVDLVVFVESLLFFILNGWLHVRPRVEFSGGLKMRLPAVWKRVWKPTWIIIKDTSIINALFFYLISVDSTADILSEYDIGIAHWVFA